MNWTGGRLRRQSHNKPDSILRIQKQHFAKTRLKQRESQIKTAAVSHLRSLFDSRTNASTDSCLYSASINNERRAAKPAWNANHSQNYICDSYETPNDGSNASYIDGIKQRLLNKDDWVGLSPTRPVQVKFASIEEKERIGKRRKLSEGEEARTSAITKRPTLTRLPLHSLEGEWSNRRNTNPGPNIEIHINTVKSPLRVYEKPESSRRTNSSDSMLLDVEDRIDEETEERPFSVDTSHSIEANRQGMLSPHEVPQTPERNHLNGDNKMQHTSKEPKMDRSLEDGALSSISSKPVLHRFTLDDQILAERGEHSGLDYYTTSKDQGLISYHPPQDRFPDSAPNERDEQETLLSFPHSSRFTEHTGSCESNPTDSDALPQTQKIARQLPPTQPHSIKQHVFATPFRTPKQSNHTQTGGSMLINVTPPIHHAPEPMVLFGQRVPSAPDLQSATDSATRHISPIPKHSFASDIQNRSNELPSDAIKRSTLINGKTREPEIVSRFPKPTSKFRFPTHWTPHRNEQQLMHADEMTPSMTIPTSPFVVALPRPSAPFSFPKDHAHVPESTNTTGDVDGRLHKLGGNEIGEVPPCFNLPFRR